MPYVYLVIFLLGLSSSVSTFAKSKSDLLVGACRTDFPVLIIDTFPDADTPVGGEIGDPDQQYENNRKKIIDINGDGINELYHGELVEALIKAEGFQVERSNLDEQRSLPELVDHLEPILRSIQSGAKKYARINLSQENPLRISAFKRELFPNDSSVPEITRENVSLYAPKILNYFFTEYPDLRIEELYNIFLGFQKMNVPVIVAAGNFGPDHVNLFSMFPGVISVGSKDYFDRKLLTSSDNAFVTEFRNGVVVPKQLESGVDLNDDFVIDFGSVQMSANPSIAGQYKGRQVSEVQSTIDPEFIEWAKRAEASGTVVPNAAANILDPGFYSVEDVVALPTVTPGTQVLFRSLGTYALKHMNGRPPHYFFDADSNGRLVYNPRGDFSTNQLNRIGGTSFAAPRICSEK